MNRHTLLFALYGSLMVSATFIHEPLWLWILGAVVWSSAFPNHLWVLKRTLTFPLFFAGVSLGGYAAFGYFASGALPENLGLIALRVFVMTLTAFTMAKRVNLVRAVAPLKGVQFILIVTLSQIAHFQKAVREAEMAYKSRCITPPTLRHRWRFYAGVYADLLEKAVHQSHMVSRGMKSRGLFDA